MRALKTSKNFRAQPGPSPRAQRWLPRVATLQSKQIEEAITGEAKRLVERRGQVLSNAAEERAKRGRMTTSTISPAPREIWNQSKADESQRSAKKVNLLSIQEK